VAGPEAPSADVFPLATRYSLALPPRKQLASDITDPIPKRLLQRPAELLPHTVHSDKDFVVIF